MATAEVRVRTELSVATVRPGDKLVVATSRMTMVEADDMLRRFRRQLPDVEIVPVEANALMVYRPEGG